MHIDFRPFIAIWAVLALAVVVLLIRRKMIAAKEDDNIHVLSNPNSDQVAVATKLDVIDKWGKLLTAITAAYGLILLALYVWTTFTGKGSLGE